MALAMEMEIDMALTTPNGLAIGESLQLQQQLTTLLYNKLLTSALQATGATQASQANGSQGHGYSYSYSVTPTPTPTPTATAGSESQRSQAVSNFTAAPLLLSAGSGLFSNNSSATSLAGSLGAASVNSYILSMAWPKAIAVAIFVLLILATIIGNTLVILAVLTTRRLRTVTNCFVLNLAITDWLVGTCVMPPSVILYITGSWRFGWILCDIWISLDILLCTGSILSLCAISLDRYLAVTQPLTYSKKRRSKRLALLMILVVWITALSITCPPYLGWYEPGRRQQGYVDCRYNQNKGYVVFSAMGSFFIPLTVMLYVYVKIGYVLTSRRQRIVRDANSERTAEHDIDADNFVSESEHYHCNPHKCLSLSKSRWRFGSLPAANANAVTGRPSNGSIKCVKCQQKNSLADKALTFKHQASFYELVEISRLSSLIHCSAISCKYGGACMHNTPAGEAAALPRPSLHYNDSQNSFSETCLAGSNSKSAGEAATVTAAATAAATAASTATLPTISQQQQQQMQQQQQGPQQTLPQAAQSTTKQHHHHHHHPHHPHHSQQQHHHHQRMPMRVSTTKRDTKTAKTLTIVMGGLIACWMPFFVYYLLIPFLPRAAVLEGLMSFFTWVGWVNCAINPFIYAFYNPDFRTAFWRLTCRRICKQKPAPNHMALFRG